MWQLTCLGKAAARANPSSHGNGMASASLYRNSSAEVLRVTFAGKKDKSLDPMEVGLLRAVTVVLAANGIAHLVEQAGWPAFGQNRYRLIRTHSPRNVRTTEGDDMAQLQIGGLRSASFHT